MTGLDYGADVKRRRPLGSHFWGRASDSRRESRQITRSTAPENAKCLPANDLSLVRSLLTWIIVVFAPSVRAARELANNAEVSRVASISRFKWSQVHESRARQTRRRSSSRLVASRPPTTSDMQMTHPKFHSAVFLRNAALDTQAADSCAPLNTRSFIDNDDDVAGT